MKKRVSYYNAMSYMLDSLELSDGIWMDNRQHIQLLPGAIIVFATSWNPEDCNSSV
jgi:hypothetical protein